MARRLDEVVLAGQGDGAIDALLSGLEDTDEPPHLVVERTSSAPARHGYEPWLFHGRIDVLRGPAGVLVIDGDVVVSVDHAGPLRLFRAPGSRWDGVLALRIALFHALRRFGLYELHAAAVVDPELGTWCLAGESGTGKSTTTLAFVAAGLQTLGDDTVLVRATPDGPRLVPFPRDVYASQRTLDAHEDLRRHGRATLDHGDKLAVPREHVPHVIEAGRFPVDALLLPRIVDEDASSLHPLPQAEGLGELVASSALVAADHIAGRDEQLALLGEIARRARVFELLCGRDLLAAPRAAALALREQLRARLGDG
jgi:hypothetical protein